MTKWRNVDYGCRENPGVFDTGNGAIMTIEQNESYPGIERVYISSYCGRAYDDRRYYRIAALGNKSPAYRTVGEAVRASR